MDNQQTLYRSIVEPLAGTGTHVRALKTRERLVERAGGKKIADKIDRIGSVAFSVAEYVL